MPSVHEQLMRDCGVPALLDALGEKQVNSSAAPPVKYWPPPYGTATEWPQAIVGELRLDEDEDYSGTRTRKLQRERVTVTIPTPADAVMRTARIEIARHAGQMFTIERFEQTPGRLRLHCVRDAVEALQRKGMERGR